MGFPGILQKLFSGGGKGGKLRPEIVPDIEPRGVVKMWYGEASAVPEGWAICDGTQGTPDLRDSFIIGAGGKYALDARGRIGNAGREHRDGQDGDQACRCRAGRHGGELGNRDRHPERRPQYLDRGGRDGDRHSRDDAGREHVALSPSYGLRICRHLWRKPKSY